MVHNGCIRLKLRLKKNVSEIRTSNKYALEGKLEEDGTGEEAEEEEDVCDLASTSSIFNLDEILGDAVNTAAAAAVDIAVGESGVDDVEAVDVESIGTLEDVDDDGDDGDEGKEEDNDDG